MVLADLAAPDGPAGAEGRAVDLRDAAAVTALVAERFDVVFHLAAVVSGQAEAELDLGLAVNLAGTLNLLQAARAAGNAPVLVFASSVAAHGGAEPELIVDGVELNPQTSYGTQKAIGELLLNDFTRRGLVDGRGLRLPTVTIRPGRPNAAASGFMSSIFRDTLQGEVSNCPVDEGFGVWHSAPRTVVANLIHAAGLDGRQLGTNRCLNLPGRTDSIGAMIAAMTRVAGPAAAARITWHRDPAIEAIVSGWRSRFAPERALALGFAADRSFEDSVRWFLADDIAAPAAG
jgi:nucleoside-diphosphate-sugar epimerase